MERGNYNSSAYHVVKIENFGDTQTYDESLYSMCYFSGRGCTNSLLSRWYYPYQKTCIYCSSDASSYIKICQDCYRSKSGQYITYGYAGACDGGVCYQCQGEKAKTETCGHGYNIKHTYCEHDSEIHYSKHD